MTAVANEFRGTTRFELLGRIGEGGAGFVYEVVDREQGARLALKTLRTVDPESILLLKNEFRAIQGLRHPNLVTPKELFEEDGHFFFTMDFVEGTDFLSYVRPRARGAAAGDDAEAIRSAPLDLERLRSALGQLVVGLSALHADHKVHRDVKPSNVLVSPSGHVRILDFGIVGEFAARPVGQREWEITGTAQYMAPEQAAGEAPTPAADWYAVGAMLYAALTGQPPFSGQTHEVLANKMIKEPPPPGAVAPNVPEDLAALVMELLRMDPARRPEGFEILAKLGLSPTSSTMRIAAATSFVGREDELRALDAAFERVRAGHAVTVFVEGDSGVGKTLLVREFTRRAGGLDDVLVFRGRCYEAESLSFKAFDSLVDDLARFLSGLEESEAAPLLPEGVGTLRTAFPVLGTIPAIRDARHTESGVRNPQEARARMFDTLRALLHNIATTRRLVLVIDDLQWADDDSIALLKELLRVPGAPPLLLLASLRTAAEASARALRDRLAHLPGDVRRIPIDPLPASDARELVRNLLSARGVGGDVGREVDAICAEAKGHPLFIEEIVRYRATQDAPAATRLDDALWERVQALGPETRHLLELVVVAGAPIAQDTVARAAELGFAKTFDSIGLLRTAHLVRTSGVYRHDTVEPYHDRVRESVLHNLDEVSQQRLHSELARALESTEKVNPEQLIPHWVGAGQEARAAECALQAGAAASAALAFDHAASLYRLAIELLKPKGEDAVALKEKLAEALTSARRGAAAAKVYLDAATDAPPMRAIDLRRRAAEHLVCSGHIDEGVRTIGSVLTAVGVSTPRSTVGVVFALLYWSARMGLRGFRFTERKEADLDPLAVLRVDCLGSAGPGLGMSDHVRGKHFQIRTAVAALGLGEPGRVARALAYYAFAIASSGTRTFARVMQAHKVVLAMAKDLKQPYLDAMATGITSFAYYTTGRWKEARASIERTEATLRDHCIGAAHELGSIRMLLSRTLFALGDIAALARLSAATVDDAEERGDVYTIVNFRTNAMSALALLRDDIAAADDELRLAEEHLPKGGFHIQHLYWLLAKVHVSLYRGDAAAAEALLVTQAPAIKRSLLLSVQSCRILFREAQARACVALAAAGAPPSAAATAERLARSIEREGWGSARAQAHVVRAGLCRIAGDLDGAAAHLISAERELASLGMELLAAVVRRRRGALLGGKEGGALVEAGDDWMAKNGIKNAARVCAVFAPGFVEGDAKR